MLEDQQSRYASSTGWEVEWGKSLRTAADLIRAELIEAKQEPAYEKILSRFRFVLPRYYASLIDRTDPACPIRLQAIPDLRELENVSGFFADPLHDLKHQPVQSITHRYRNRALVHLTSNCSMFCRFCFRKTLLNELSDELFGGKQDEVLLYVGKHTEIEEVIFSGGDPLMVSDARLRSLLARLAEIPHLKRLRFHTRVPVTFPMRVTESLVDAITSTRLPVVVVTHFNHPKEITDESRGACDVLFRAGVTLFNQSVLLNGVNASAGVLRALSELLFAERVLPYYLHHPDRAQGTHHFDVDIDTGRAIYHELRQLLPGYLVPKYVIDRVGVPYKTMVAEPFDFN